MPWLFDEDYALKEKLQNYTTVNYASGNQVDIEVYFRFPDAEIRERTFPHIAIDLIRIEFDPTRAHRNVSYIVPYPTEMATPPSGNFLIADDFPLPWMLIYQLGTFARSPIDDRYMQIMMYRLFPEMYGFLDMSAFDGTVRRADFVSAERRDVVDQDQKRLYRNFITVAISSQFYLNQLQYIQQVSQIDIDFQFTGSVLVPPSS